jgi:hypothetical protein
VIRPLRQRHRLLLRLLAVVLPVSFGIGLAARRPIPVSRDLPREWAPRSSDFGGVVLSRADLWPDRRFLTLLRRDSSGALAVELLLDGLIAPDLLLYWTGAGDTAPERLPEDARLLGACIDRMPLPIPQAVRGTTGRLVLYSLAEHQVMAASRNFTLSHD